ncbi:hypothetical protein LINPERPRIM_LOCUS30017, partial [Linum perenne]
KEVLDKDVDRLKAAVVVKFLCSPPSFRVFTSVANRLWGYERGVLISALQANFYLVEFNHVKLYDWVLSRSWHIHNTRMIMRRWARGIKPVEISDGHAPEWITFQKVPPVVITIEGISWLSSWIGKPMRKFVREGLDIKVCIIIDKAIPCPESISVFDEEDEHVIPVIQAKARDYRAGGRKRRVRTEPTKVNGEANAQKLMKWREFLMERLRMLLSKRLLVMRCSNTLALRLRKGKLKRRREIPKRSLKMNLAMCIVQVRGMIFQLSSLTLMGVGLSLAMNLHLLWKGRVHHQMILFLIGLREALAMDLRLLLKLRGHQSNNWLAN